MHSIRAQICVLYKIQDIETERLELVNKINDVIPMKLALIEAKIARYHSDLENDKKLLMSFEKKYREAETDLNLIDSSIIKSNTKISQIKSNKEYKLNLKEIDILNDKRNSLEDDMFKYLENIEYSEISISEKMKLLTIHEERLTSDKTSILDEEAKNISRLNNLGEKIENFRESIDPQILLSFDNLAKKIKNNPVALVFNSTCLGCNIQLPYQLFIELQKFNELKFCPNCRRIIYWDDSKC